MVIDIARSKSFFVQEHWCCNDEQGLLRVISTARLLREATHKLYRNIIQKSEVTCIRLVPAAVCWLACFSYSIRVFKGGCYQTCWCSCFRRLLLPRFCWVARCKVYRWKLSANSTHPHSTCLFSCLVLGCRSRVILDWWRWWTAGIFKYLFLLHLFKREHCSESWPRISTTGTLVHLSNFFQVNESRIVTYQVQSSTPGTPARLITFIRRYIWPAWEACSPKWPSRTCLGRSIFSAPHTSTRFWCYMHALYYQSTRRY